jgi:DnaK suppressor protein
MNEEDLEQFRHRLMRLRAEFQNLEVLPKEATMPEDLDEADSCGLSRKEAMQAQLIIRKAASLRRREFDKIEGALRRMQAGAYGNCFLCGEEIDSDRLSEDPTNTRCIQCVEE